MKKLSEEERKSFEQKLFWSKITASIFIFGTIILSTIMIYYDSTLNDWK